MKGSIIDITQAHRTSRWEFGDERIIFISYEKIRRTWLIDPTAISQRHNNPV